MKRILLLLFAGIIAAGADAAVTETLVLKDGTTLNGNIIRQNIGMDIVFLVSNSETRLEKSEVNGQPHYKEEIAMGEDMYIVDFKLNDGREINDVILVDATGDYYIYKSKDVSNSSKRQTVHLSDVEKIIKPYQEGMSSGLLDELELQDGRRVRGQITENIYGVGVVLTDANGSTTYRGSEIAVQRKVGIDSTMSITDQADAIDTIQFADGNADMGVIVEQDYRYSTVILLTMIGEYHEYEISNIRSISKSIK